MTNPTPPEGWVMVPREPTEEMIEAVRYTKQNHWQSALRAAYRAMIASAPTPPATGQSLESDPGTGRQEVPEVEYDESDGSYSMRWFSVDNTAVISLTARADNVTVVGTRKESSGSLTWNGSIDQMLQKLTAEDLPQDGSALSLSDRLLNLAEGWEKEAGADTAHVTAWGASSEKANALRHAAQQAREALKND